MGHDADCLCTTCVVTDMDAHLAARGVEIAWSAAELNRPAAERTRYLQLGALVGTGVVRHVSERLRVGIYRHDDGRIVLVKPSRQDRLYGKLYNAENKNFEYAPGLLRGLTNAHRMTVEDAEALSVEMGACCMCGRELTATVNGVTPSQRYIGPICEGKVRG